ncbi:hypothetical protein [Streptomyces sp. NPDC047972]|uniref:hypothetical protein n=1 Tax=Streptomyces sp. NPDC047972 TaxID=3365493 RepID=UPI003721E479
MTRSENEVDQIVFRWDSENLTGNTGFGPVAWSGPREEAENLFRTSGTVLRASGEETRPALIRLQRRSEVMLIHRTLFKDADGGTSVLCHALVGSPELLEPATCLGLHAWDWEGAAMDGARVRGQLPVIPEHVLVPATGRGQGQLDSALEHADAELVGMVAELLRHPEERFTVLDERGDTAGPVLWGLHSMFGALTGRRWTFATHDTAELTALRFVFVGRWTGAASRNADRRRVDPRERVGDRAEEVAARLVHHHLRGVAEGEGREYAVGSALHGASSAVRGLSLLETSVRALDVLDRRHPGGYAPAPTPPGRPAGPPAPDTRPPAPPAPPVPPAPEPRRRWGWGLGGRSAGEGPTADGTTSAGPARGGEPAGGSPRGEGRPGPYESPEEWFRPDPPEHRPPQPSRRPPENGPASDRQEHRPAQSSRRPPEDRPVREPSDPPGNRPVQAPRHSPEGRPVREPLAPPEDRPALKPSDPPGSRPVPFPRPAENRPDREPSTPAGDRPVREPLNPAADRPVREPLAPPEHRPARASLTPPENPPVQNPPYPPEGRPGSSSAHPPGRAVEGDRPPQDPSRLPDPAQPTHPAPDTTPSRSLRKPPAPPAPPTPPAPEAAPSRGSRPYPSHRPPHPAPDPTPSPSPRPSPRPAEAESDSHRPPPPETAPGHPYRESRTDPEAADERSAPLVPDRPRADAPGSAESGVRPPRGPGAVAHPRPDLPLVAPVWTGSRAAPGRAWAAVRARGRERQAETGLLHKLPAARTVDEAQELVEHGGDRELLESLRGPQAYSVLTLLLREVARRLPSWEHALRRELCEVAIAREFWAVAPAGAAADPSDPPPEQRAANAAELHRWAVRPVLAGGDAPVGTVAELLVRLRASPVPSARETFWLIVEGERPGLPEAVWLTLLTDAYGLPRTARRPAATVPGDAVALPDDDGSGYTRRFLRRAGLLIGGLVVAIVLLVSVRAWFG